MRSTTFSTTTMMVTTLLAAAVLTACESPMAQRYVDRPAPNSPELIVARALTTGTYRGENLTNTTAIGPVQELARIDSPGPDNAPAPGNAPAVDVAQAVTPANSDPAPATAPRSSATAPSYAGQITAESAVRLNANENVLSLSLQEAIARGLKNALAIKVEAYNPAIKESQIIEAEAAFDPVLFGGSQWSSNDQPQFGFTASSELGQSWQNQIGIKKLLPSGAQAQISTGFTYRDISDQATINARFPNSYAANIGAQITQPLLKGFGTDVNFANIYLAQRDRRISLAQFRRQVIQTVADIEEAYYNLVLAKANVYVQERLLQVTISTQEHIKARVEVDADKIQISQVGAAVESRNAELIRARATHRNASDRLKTVMNDPALDIRNNSLLNPTDKPLSAPIAFNIAEQIDIGLRQRTELQEARLQIERADIVLTVAKNDLLPKLDVTLSAQSNSLDSNFGSSYGDTVSPAHNIDFGAGLRFELPLGNNEADAKLRRTLNQRDQALVQMARIAQEIVLDVKQQLRDILTSYQEIQARERSRLSAANQLEAIIQKEAIAPLTPEFLNLKLQAQSQLAQAELSEIATSIGYNLALMKLEKAKGTLLEYNRIALDRLPMTHDNSDKGKIRFMGQTYTVK